MRLVIDLQCCQSGSGLGGIGRYSLDLARAMIADPGDDEVIVIMNNLNPQRAEWVRSELSMYLPPTAFKTFNVPDPCNFLHSDPQFVRAVEILRERFIEDLRPDVLHVTSLFEGLSENTITSVKRVTKTPTAVTLYDLIPLVNKDLYLRDGRLRAHYIQKFRQLSNADLLLAISQYSADEGRSLIEGFEGRIVNLKNGIDPKFRPISSNSPELTVVLQKFGINRDFLLYTASYDQRKNQKGLIEAFSLLPAFLRARLQLVFVGNGWPGVYDSLRAHAVEFGVDPEQLVFAGHVTDGELIAMYSACRLFVFPSVAEGLGLPPLEAMACGATVVASCTTATAEVVGMAEALFDPTDPAEIAKAITRGCQDRKFRDRFARHRVEQLKKYTWQDSAKTAWSAMRDMVRVKAEEGGHAVYGPVAQFSEAAVSKSLSLLRSEFPGRIFSLEQMHGLAASAALNMFELSGSFDPSLPQPRIGWVTTWGSRCGIAAYSAKLVQAIDSSVRILAPLNEGFENEDPPNVYRCWNLGQTERLESLARTIETLDLTDIMVQVNYGFFNFDALNKLVEQLVGAGRRVYVTIHATHEKDPSNSLVTLTDALHRASAIFVHTTKDATRLNDLGVLDRVMTLPHAAYAFTPPARQAKDRRSHTIAAYGFFLPGKGIPELVEAVKILRESGREIELLLVNANYGDEGGVSSALIKHVQEMVADLELTGAVKFHTDFLDPARSLELLSSADLVVFPYQRSGESSSAAVRMGLASGRPIAVTPLDVFSDVSAVTIALPGTSPDAMAVGINSLLDEITRGSSRLRELERNLNHWRRVTNVKSVSRYIEHVIGRSFLFDAWVELYAAKAEEIRLQSGSKQGQFIRGDKPALLTYGPWIRIPPGTVRLQILGFGANPDGEQCGRLVMRVLGEAPILEAPLEAGAASGSLLDVTFGNPRPEDNVEILVYVEQGASIVISEIKLWTRSKVPTVGDGINPAPPAKPGDLDLPSLAEALDVMAGRDDVQFTRLALSSILARRVANDEGAVKQFVRQLQSTRSRKAILSEIASLPDHRYYFPEASVTNFSADCDNDGALRAPTFVTPQLAPKVCERTEIVDNEKNAELVSSNQYYKKTNAVEEVSAFVDAAVDPVIGHISRPMSDASAIETAPANVFSDVPRGAVQEDDKDFYVSLESVLERHDRDFLHVAYITVLGRVPDPEGEAYYLARIRRGVPKLDILKQLRQSPEGLSGMPRIIGLDERIKRHVRNKLPVIGPVMKFLTGE